MALTIDLAADVESTRRSQYGSSLEERAKQDLAAAWFSEGRIASRQVAGVTRIGRPMSSQMRPTA